MLVLCPAAYAGMETLTVVAPTPVDAGRAPTDAQPAIQITTREIIEQQRSASIADLLNSVAANVTVNEAQGNPLQADLQYRGFVASPLLGLPQGLAVYMDGVRINEPFGDTVNWSLIPQAALRSILLMPGSNPLYGLNTLGGAIAVQTRTGLDGNRADLEVATGSFGRRTLAVSAGGASGAWHGFAAVEQFDDDGWRDFSPSHSDSVFMRGGWSGADTRLNLSLSRAETNLIGNGAAPVELLALDRSAVYTTPDQAENRLRQATLWGEHSVSDRWLLRGNAYLRHSDVDSLNGDDSDFEPCDDDPAFICEGEGDVAEDLSGTPIPAIDPFIGATVNRTATAQKGAGFGVESLWHVAGGRGTFILGFARDKADIRFIAGTELGTLDANRSATGGGVYLGEAVTNLTTDVSNSSAYAALSIPFGDAVVMHAAGRFNRTDVVLRDQLGTALNGDHAFSRFNPSLGFTWQASNALAFFASYAESNRAPSPVELTCADEDDPCRLPNAFLADPPLSDVVARTAESGLSFTTDAFRLRVSAFRTINDDDILFISAGALTNEGFFDNVGRTRREGLELVAAGGNETLRWSLGYAWLDATFDDSFTVASANHPRAIDGEVDVASGDRIPLVPRTTAKATLTWDIDPVSVSLGLRHSGGIHYRGDEANLLGEFGSVTLASLRGEWRLHRHVTLTLDVDNLLDREFESFGVFGEADEVLGDGFGNPEFRTPGAPRTVYAGVRLSL